MFTLSTLKTHIVSFTVVKLSFNHLHYGKRQASKMSSIPLYVLCPTDLTTWHGTDNSKQNSAHTLSAHMATLMSWRHISWCLMFRT